MTGSYGRAGRRRSRRPGELTLLQMTFFVGTFFAGVLLAGLAISTTASGSPACTNVNPTTTICQNPGNAQISTSPGTIATPFWGWPYWGGGLIISIGP